MGLPWEDSGIYHQQQPIEKKSKTSPCDYRQSSCRSREQSILPWRYSHSYFTTSPWGWRSRRPPCLSTGSELCHYLLSYPGIWVWVWRGGLEIPGWAWPAAVKQHQTCRIFWAGAWAWAPYPIFLHVSHLVLLRSRTRDTHAANPTYPWGFYVLDFLGTAIPYMCKQPKSSGLRGNLLHGFSTDISQLHLNRLDRVSELHGRRTCTFGEESQPELLSSALIPLSIRKCLLK